MNSKWNPKETLNDTRNETLKETLNETLYEGSGFVCARQKWVVCARQTVGRLCTFLLCDFVIVAL